MELFRCDSTTQILKKNYVEEIRYFNNIFSEKILIIEKLQ